MEAFFQAVKGGNEGGVTRLLDVDPTLLERAGEAGERPLMMAAMHGQLGVAKLLMQRGATMTATSSIGSTALHLAAQEGHEAVVAWLLGQGAHATRRETDGVTPFMLACERRHVGVARLLLHHTGYQALQETIKDGWTALHLAASWADEERVTFLLEQGAQASSRTEYGSTPLMLTCGKGQLGVAKVLLQHVGEQALQETDSEGLTAVHHATVGGHEETVAFLLGEGAEANSRGPYGMTPLLWACKEGFTGVVRLLLHHVGSEALHETETQGWTALHVAAYGGHEETASFLISEGVQANSRDNFGVTPLMRACEKGRLGVVKVLLQLGSEALQETDVNGATALHWAAEEGHAEVVRLLLVAGADPTVTDNEGRTPLEMADEEEDEEEEEEEEEEEGSRAGCVAVFQWYACELERRRVIHRAACLRKACTMQRDMPTSQVPTYLAARVAAGHALPRVEVVLPQSQSQAGEHEEQAVINGDTQAVDEGGNAEEAEAGEEMHAVMTYVLEALNEELVIELLDGFPCET